MRGESIAVAMIILLLILIVAIVPALIILNERPIYSFQGLFEESAMVQFQERQNIQVFRGNPSIYYNSSSTPSLKFYFSSLPTPFDITQIYYYNGSMWVPVLGTHFIVPGNVTLALPVKAFNKPVIVLTALGNVYFLNPNTSTPLLPPSSPGLYPLYILAINQSSTSKQGNAPSFTVYIKFGTNTIELGGSTGNVGVMYYLSPGVYALNDTTISVPQTNFKGWYVVGDGAIVYQSQGFVVFKVWGPAVLEAIYEG